VNVLVSSLCALVLAAGSEEIPTNAPQPPAPQQLPADAPARGVSLAERKAPSEFVKGELSVYLGSDRLVVKNTRIGVSAGLDSFEGAYYLLLEPMLDLRFLDAKLGIGLAVPLRIKLADFTNATTFNDITKDAGKLRTQDYATVHDFGRVLNYVTYGRKEDPLYISAGQRYASTLGHGTIMRRYAPNIDINYPRASAQLDAYNSLGGFEAFTNDLLEWNTLGALGFIKPLSPFAPNNLILSTLSFGVTAVTDRTAPSAIQTDSFGVRRVVNNRFVADVKPVTLLGFDAEVKVVKTENVDVKPYVDFSQLLGGDGGLTVGALGRFNVGTDTINAFRVVAEIRQLGSRYQPGYFDTFYEIERFKYAVDRSDPSRAVFIPKGTYILDHGLGARTGYYVEGSWGVPGRVGLTLALEGVLGATPEKNAIAHLEVPVLDFLQFFASWYKRGITDFSGLTRLDQQTIMYAGARLKILPFLFVNGRAYKTFRMDPDLQDYKDDLGFSINVEIGYEFRKSEVPPPPQTLAPAFGDAVAERR
jgi:hypothetical protein